MDRWTHPAQSVLTRTTDSWAHRAPASCALLAALLAPSSWAQSPSPPEEATKAATSFHYGLLRSSDLTPFGFLRLDMRPAHALSEPPGSWGVEIEVGYQNTWALSPNVRSYLDSLPGRRKLGAGEIQAIRDLPGEAYLVDLELGLLDLTFHRKLTDHWGVYATFSAVAYTGGFMDGGIEWFHDRFSMSPVGRPAVSRDDINVILDLKGMQLYQPQLPDNGLLDPTFGVRYTAARSPTPWNLVVEAAVKVPVSGERAFLSTGHYDFGTQITLQRFYRRHAGYASLAAVYTKGSDAALSYGTQVVPTAILGYEYAASDRTNLNLQLYASRSVYRHSDTDLSGLLDSKYMVSLGVRYRIGASLLTFALTENLVNYDNSPDIGFQIGWAYSPAIKR
jgi:uncharacterized protein DUF3187